MSDQEQPRFVKPQRRAAAPPNSESTASSGRQQVSEASVTPPTFVSAGSSAHPSEAEVRIAHLATKLNSKFLVRKELMKLPAMLNEHEQVESLAQGKYEGNQGLIVATDRRIMFIDEGLVRSRREDFAYSRISSIQVSTGFLSGTLTIFASGNKAQLTDVLPKQQAQALGDYIRIRIDDGPSPASSAPLPGVVAATPPVASPAPASSDADDVFGKLTKLGALRDAGVITDAEFEAKKSELLGQI